jgi:phosphatidylglycerol:prolipoprotein diacylglycerol transferase
MIPFPRIDPEIVRVGPLAIRWYGMMYLLGFGASYLLVKFQMRKKGLDLGKDFLGSLYSYLVLGLLIGARLGYVVFYNFSYYAVHPLEIFAVWQGGMSFHGGIIGSVIAGILFCRKIRHDFWEIADLVVATAPIGIGLGRLGNFINGELYGRVSDLPWAMVFPSGGPFPRHPSQLYEFLFEGVVLFIVLWTLKNRGFRPGVLTGVFILLYGFLRFIIEFFRQPDPQIGFVLGPFTMGHILCSAMILIGSALVYIRSKR